MRSFVKVESAPSAVEAAPAEGAAPVIEAAPATAAVVPAAPRAVSTHVAPSAYVEGEITKEDLKMPYLSCVQAVGPKSVLHTQGTVLLGEMALGDAPKPKEPTIRLRVLFCKVQKTYVENLPYNPAPDAPRPKVFKTASEVVAAGGILEWRGNTAPSYLPKLTALALVRSPEGFDDAQFNVIDGEKTYAPAMVSFQKTSYSAAKTLLTDLSLSLKNDPTATFYDLFWVREQKGQNWVWVAKLVRVREEKPGDSLKEMAKRISGAQVEVVEDEEAATH